MGYFSKVNALIQCTLCVGVSLWFTFGMLKMTFSESSVVIAAAVAVIFQAAQFQFTVGKQTLSTVCIITILYTCSGIASFVYMKNAVDNDIAEARKARALETESARKASLQYQTIEAESIQILELIAFKKESIRGLRERDFITKSMEEEKALKPLLDKLRKARERLNGHSIAAVPQSPQYLFERVNPAVLNALLIAVAALLEWITAVRLAQFFRYTQNCGDPAVARPAQPSPLRVNTAIAATQKPKTPQSPQRKTPAPPVVSAASQFADIEARVLALEFGEQLSMRQILKATKMREQDLRVLVKRLATEGKLEKVGQRWVVKKTN